MSKQATDLLIIVLIIRGCTHPNSKFFLVETPPGREMASSASSAPPSITKFFYVLSQTWTPTVGRVHRQDLREFCYWVLHGLWLNTPGIKLTGFVYPLAASYEDRQYTTEIAADGNLSRKLSVIWPNLTPGQTIQDYHHRMLQKHGVVAIYYNHLLHRTNITDPKSYFRTAANLGIEYNVGNYLKGVHLNKKHKIGHLIDHVKHKFGHEPYIKTTLQLTDPTNLQSPRSLYLDQIYLYFDENFEPIDSREENLPPDTEITYLACDSNLNAISLPTQPKPSQRWIDIQPNKSKAQPNADNK